MKKNFVPLCSAAVLLLTSCATLFNGSKSEITVKNDAVTTPVTLSYDNKVENDVTLPHKIKVKRGFKSTTITATADGYGSGSVSLDKKFNATTLLNILWGGIPGLAIDAATGAMMKPEQKEITIPMKP